MELRLLGPLEAGPETAPVRVAARKPRSLLAALALSPGRAVALDVLTDTLWGERPPASASKLLQTYVSQLRSTLPLPEALVTRAPGYALDVPLDDVDASRFARLVAAGSHARSVGAAHDAAALLRQALDLWRDDPLADVGPAVLFDTEAARLEELRLRALEDWYAVRVDLGDAADVCEDLQALAVEHPLREGLHASLVLALYRCDRQADALAAYERVRTALRDELGLDPGAGLRDLRSRLLRQEPELDAGPPQQPSRLPVPVTPTIGREHELAQLAELLADRENRLVTIVGPGGTGKTRIATVAAARAAPTYAGGAAMVALQAVREPALVLTTICAALGVRGTDADPVATLARELGRRELLLVLDNLEQAVAVAPALGELLALVPGLTLLVTSRVVLQISGERVFPLPPLALPSSADHAAAADSPAVELFCHRAVATLPSFTLTEANSRDVVELCRRLDGLPLAIELAAAQSRVLSPAQLLQRLSSRLDAPGPGQRDRPLRHQSLRSALDGSHELLSPAAAALFARLSVFAGGFDLDAAEAVCAATPAGLAELVDHSLVQVGALEQRSFSLLETVREYAAERLADAADLRRRHAAYFLALAESANAEVDGPQQAELLAVLDREQDNMREAFAGLRADQDAEGELRLAVALARFWYVRGHLAESRARITQALERVGELSPQLTADALRKLSANAMLAGSYGEALAHAEQALVVYEQIGDEVGRARSLSNIGAFAHAAGDLPRAAERLDAAIALARDIGATRVSALALNNRGDLCLTLGDFEQATRLFSDSRVLLEEQGDTTNVARSLLNLALAALGRGAEDEASELITKSLGLCVELRDNEDVAWCLLARAAVDSRTGSPERAALLLGAAEAVLRSMEAVLKPYERSLHASTIAALVDVLGSAGFEDARARGGALRLGDAVLLAGS